MSKDISGINWTKPLSEDEKQELIRLQIQFDTNRIIGGQDLVRFTELWTRNGGRADL